MNKAIIVKLLTIIILTVIVGGAIDSVRETILVWLSYFLGVLVWDMINET